MKSLPLKSALCLLFRPVITYWRIKGPTTHALNIHVTLLTVLLLIFIFTEEHYFRISFNLFHHSGLIPKLGSGFFTLTGFFITSLAASASLKGSEKQEFSFDRPLHHYTVPIPSIDEDGLQKQIRAEITYRQFFCLLFAYLAVSSALFCFLGFISPFCQEQLSQILLKVQEPKYIILILRYIFCGIFLFFLIHLVITALLGIYLLSQKIHNLGTSSD